MRFLVLLLLLPPPAADAQPALWALSDDDSTVYLLGSIHFLKPEVYPLSEPIEVAYADAEVLALELDVDAAVAAASDMSGPLFTLGLYQDGTTLGNHIDHDLHTIVNETAIALGMPSGSVDFFRPWTIVLTFTGFATERAGYNATDGVDHHFFHRAKEEGKEIVAFETLAQQAGFYAALDPDTQTTLLRQTIDEVDGTEAHLDHLLALWLSGDIEAIATEVDGSLLPELRAPLLHDRNHAWIPQIEALLARTDEDALVVVGAAHLVGEEGVVALLEAKGYTVEQR